jgi:hypothetical protein
MTDGHEQTGIPGIDRSDVGDPVVRRGSKAHPLSTGEWGEVRKGGEPASKAPSHILLSVRRGIGIKHAVIVARPDDVGLPICGGK